MASKATVTGYVENRGGAEPWQTWPWTLRYLVVRLAQALPNGTLVWLAYMHR
jgi:hypothetical protein